MLALPTIEPIPFTFPKKTRRQLQAERIRKKRIRLFPPKKMKQPIPEPCYTVTFD